jgi:hypothetical protein
MDTKKANTWNARLISCVAAAFLLVFLVKPSDAKVVQIVVDLDGAQEVPPTSSSGTGIGHLTVNTVTGAISGSVDFKGLSSPTTAGHIHMGVMGMNGPIIVPLIGGVGVTQGAMSVPAGGVMLTPMQLDALKDDGLYVNIHTKAHLDGEIRGQIMFTGAM